MSPSSYLNIWVLAIVPFAMAAVGGYLAATVIESKVKKVCFIAFFGLFLVLGVVGAVILQGMVDKNQQEADERTQKRDQVIDNMNGQIGVMGQQITSLSSSLAVVSAKVAQPAPPVQVTIKPPESPAARPAPLSLESKTDAELADYALSFAERLRAFEKKKDEQVRQLEFSMPRASADPEERDRLWRQQANTLTQAIANFDNEYRRQFWTDALALRDEFRRRYESRGKSLPPPATNRIGLSIPLAALDGSMAGPYPLDALATFFELLVKEMPASR